MGEVSRWTIPVASLMILVSAILVLSCVQTDTHRERITHAAHRLTHATVVGVSRLETQAIAGMTFKAPSRSLLMVVVDTAGTTFCERFVTVANTHYNVHKIKSDTLCLSIPQN